MGADEMASSKADQAKRPYTAREVMTLLGVNLNLVYEMANRNELPVIKVGKRKLFPRSAIDRLLAEGNGKAA
jgi:excisionase family DNA binding protein